jgi:hypothetical protein
VSEKFDTLKAFIFEVLDGFGCKFAGKDGVQMNLRYDTSVKKSTNVLDDEETELETKRQDTECPMPYPDVVLPPDAYLSVARPKSSAKMRKH